MVLSFRPIPAAAAVLLAAMFVVSVSGPASAHGDLEVVASTPSSDERLAVPPTDVVIQFSEEVLAEGAEIMIMDESGHDWAAGDAVVPGEDTVTIHVEAGMPAAGYEIRWRVISPDGDPVSNRFRFTVGDGAPFTAVAAEGTTSQKSDTGQQTQSDQGANLRTLLIGVAGAALAVGVLVLIMFIRRRAHGSDDSAATGK